MNIIPLHIPVLPEAVLHYLAPSPGEVVVDATTGLGGHTRLLAERVLPGGKVLALDQDAEMLAKACLHLEGLPVDFQTDNFHRLFSRLQVWNPAGADIVLADLGICSAQLDTAERGFSFQQTGPLDMRMDRAAGETAAELVNRLNERDLADLIYEYGEERFSRRIARKIAEVRRATPLETTDALADLVRKCIPYRPRGKGKSIDPATRVFQALRIAVNDELGSLERFLKALPDCLKPGGRVAVISFHSLEDRLVKHAFRDRETWEVLTKKPVQASEEEAQRNPRARSAKLRAARRLSR